MIEVDFASSDDFAELPRSHSALRLLRILAAAALGPGIRAADKRILSAPPKWEVTTTAPPVYPFAPMTPMKTTWGQQLLLREPFSRRKGQR